MREFVMLAGCLLASILTTATVGAELDFGGGDLEPVPQMTGPLPVGPAAWWSWQAGAEATYLSLNSPSLEQETIRFGFEATPRIWLGVQNANGWGGQLRYWQLDADSQSLETFGTALGIINSNVEMYTLDAELLRSWQGPAWGLMATFGGRHASFQDSIVVSAHDTGGSIFPPEFTGILNRDFNGGGLTGSLQLTRALGDGDWKVFGNVRGSALWGHESRRQHSIFILNGILAGPVMADVIDNAKQSIFETQFGLMWSHYLECCRGSVFARTAFEYQHWDTSAGPIGQASVLDADLYGVAFAVGFQR